MRTKRQLGYGRFTFDGKQQMVHRLALAEKLGRRLRVGEISRHVCDVPHCVNPAHLEAGPMKWNEQQRQVVNALFAELDAAAAETTPGGMRMTDGGGDVGWLLSRTDLADYVRRCFRVALERAGETG